MISSKTARRVFSRAVFLASLIVAAWPVAPASADAPMTTGGLTSQPIGHYEFCKASPGECSIRIRDTRPAKMSDGLWDLLVSTNAEVNAAVKPMSDLDIYGKDEVWAYPDNGVGDCEDYVLEKRRRLQGEGMSLADLLITVVRKPDGEGHAVLTVRTTKGDFILDNLTDAIKEWDETGYRFLKRQAADHTGRWVAIRDGQAPLVGSVQ